MATTILGIESSCDETAAAVLVDGKLHANIIYQQTEHKKHGGVIPEVASRSHINRIVNVVNKALTKANIDKKQLDAVAYTQGPGLLGSLMVGSSFAKSISYSLNIPVIPVNHMQAHLLVHFIDDGFKKPEFPFLGLNISGGHTQLVKVNTFFDFEIIGQTLDDAVGEAYDKIGKMFGLEYPAGPIIDKFSSKGNRVFNFTKPKVKGLDFSFSGLKTNVLYFLRKEQAKNKKFIKENIFDLCCSCQTTINEILIEKLKKAIYLTSLNNVVLGGGVSANKGLRKELNGLNAKVFLPKISYATDNAAMIALVGFLKFKNGLYGSLTDEPIANMKI